jgi:V-type H+-transporting ATPase subunit a
MTFGIFLKGANAIYFESALDFFCEFIPQLVFLICTFGYMDFLIIVKWLTVYPPEEAPSIITTMIDMVLNPFSLVPSTINHFSLHNPSGAMVRSSTPSA